MPMKKKTANKKTATKKTSGVNTQGMDPEFISLLNAMKPLDKIEVWDEILEEMVPHITYNFIDSTAEYIIATALNDPEIDIESDMNEDKKERIYKFGYYGCDCGLVLKTTGIQVFASYALAEFDTEYYKEYASVKTIAEIEKTLDRLAQNVIAKTILAAAKRYSVKLK